jgi:hypothetical protein
MLGPVVPLVGWRRGGALALLTISACGQHSTWGKMNDDGCSLIDKG